MKGSTVKLFQRLAPCDLLAQVCDMSKRGYVRWIWMSVLLLGFAACQEPGAADPVSQEESSDTPVREPVIPRIEREVSITLQAPIPAWELQLVEVREEPGEVWLIADLVADDGMADKVYAQVISPITLRRTLEMPATASLRKFVIATPREQEIFQGAGELPEDVVFVPSIEQLPGG